MDERPETPSPFASLTLVLPAYNEEESPRAGARRAVRLPPAARRSAPRGRPGVGQPARIGSGSSSSTTAAPTRTADLVRARPEAAAEVREAGAGRAVARRVARPAVGPPRREGRGGQGRDAGRRQRRGRLRRRRHGDAAGPAARAGRGPRRRRRRARQPDPARRLGHAPDPARASGGCSGKVFHALAAVWVTGPGPGHPVRVQGLHAGRRPRPVRPAAGITSIVFDVELIYLARRRGYRIAIVPIQWFDRRGSRMQTRPGLAAASGLGPVPDPVPPSRGPSPAMTADRLPGDGGRAGWRPAAADRRPCRWPSRRGRRGRPGQRRVDARLRHAAPTSTPRVGLLDGAAALRHVDRPGRGRRAVLLLAAVHPARRARSRCCRPRSTSRGWTVAILAAFGLGVALLPVSRDVRWLVVLLAGLSWPFAYAVKLGQVGPILFLCFAIGWRWMDRPGPARAWRSPSGRSSSSSRRSCSCGPRLTRRWAAIGVGLVVLARRGRCRDGRLRPRRVGRLADDPPLDQRPDHDAAQLHAGRGRLPDRARRGGWRRPSRRSTRSIVARASWSGPACGRARPSAT